MRTVAVVLHYGDPAKTRRCVAALDCAYLVVDNGTGAELADLGQVLRLSENRGFAGGMNAGAAWAMARGAEAVLLVNNDAVLGPGCAALLAAAGADLAAPTIVHGLPPAEGPLWYAGGALSRVTGEARHFTADPVADAPVPVSFVSGCVLLVRAAAWRELDEGYFLYHEDADLCWRALDAGLTIVWVPAARAWHEGGAATGSQARKAPALDYYDARNGLRLLRQHLSGPRLALALAWWACVRVPRKALRLLLRGPRRLGFRALRAGIRDGLRGCTGSWERL